MDFYRTNVLNQWWSLKERRDGQLGCLSRGLDGWEWMTDLRRFRMAEQLRGTAPTLQAALQQRRSTR